MFREDAFMLMRLSYLRRLRMEKSSYLELQSGESLDTFPLCEAVISTAPAERMKLRWNSRTAVPLVPE